MKKIKINWHDVEDLAALVLGLEDDAQSDAIERELWDKLEISFEDFQNIVEVLLPFTIPAKSPLTDTVYHGFVNDGAFVVKAELK
jgi:hypothetical protein